MDCQSQKDITTDPCGPKVQPGPGPRVSVRPSPASQPAVREPPAFSSPDLLRNQAPKQGEQQRLVSPPAGLMCISRPRPTALGTKGPSRLPRVPLELSEEIDLIPVCIPGPQSANVMSHSTSEPSFPLSCPQSPQLYLDASPSMPLSNPNLSRSLSPKPDLSPQSQKTLSPGGSRQSQDQPERAGGENKDFR